MKQVKGPSNKQFWFSVALVAFGCGMLTAGFIVSPTGEIHGSVLAAFGEILTFAGAALGFDYYNRKTYLTISKRHNPDTQSDDEEKNDE